MAITKVSRNLLSTGIDDQSNATAITIDSSENVAITGNLSASKLSSNNGILELDDNGSHNGVINVPASLSINIDSDNGATTESFTVSKDKTGINDTDVLFRVMESGNVGIGTSSPSSYSKLDVAGLVKINSSRDTYVDASEDAGASAKIFVTAAGSGDFSQEAGHLVMQARTHTSVYRDIIFAGGINNAGTLMKIKGEGDILVGSTSNVSGTRMYIDGGSSNLGQLGLRNSSATSGNHWRIGQNTDSHYTHYNQSGTGVYLLNGGTSWSGNSDETLKENIVELSSVLDKVKDFRCVEYNLISDETNSKKIGFIAQDWQEDYSQVISQDENGKLGMAYTETIPVLLKAIQEQQTIIELLETRITALEG
jgi:hypothetical protein